MAEVQPISNSRLTIFGQRSPFRVRSAPVAHCEDDDEREHQQHGQSRQDQQAIKDVIDPHGVGSGLGKA